MYSLLPRRDVKHRTGYCRVPSVQPHLWLKQHLDLMAFPTPTAAWNLFFFLASLRLAVKLWDLSVSCQIKPDVHHLNRHRKRYEFALKAFIDCKYFY